MTYEYNGISYPFSDIEEVKETHLSIVFIGKHYVYKQKKPVHFSFVDYSILEKRVECAHLEIVLNRRTTTAMYRGLAFLVRQGDAFTWADQSCLNGELLPEVFDEVLVVMRRIDERYTLAMLLEDSNETDERLACRIRSLSDRLIEFHRSQVLIPSEVPSYSHSVEQYMLDNFCELRKLYSEFDFSVASHTALSVTESFTGRLLEQKREIFAQRLSDGHVVDGHGDLRLDHICFETQEDKNEVVQIFDCLEFNRDLRVSDCVSEIGFLSMNLDFQWRADLANLLETTYQAGSSDYQVESVLPCFKVYRSLVRAKVHGLRLRQLNPDQSAYGVEYQKVVQYVALASRYALSVKGPLLLLVSGLMGTGKSTVSRTLSDLLHAMHVNSDVVRKDLSLTTAPTKLSRGAGFGEGIYSSEHTQRTYHTLGVLAEQQLKRRNPVIVDATFSKREYRQALYEMARREKAVVVLFECVAPEHVTLNRLQQRYERGVDVSDARPDLYRQQVNQWESIQQSECQYHFTIDTYALSDAALAPEIARLAGSFGGGRTP